MKKELKALTQCKEHWEYMAKTGAAYKLHYFLYIEDKPDDSIYEDIKRPLNECYICEYNKELKNFKNLEAQNISSTSSTCPRCLLKGYAWTTRSNDTPCLSFFSYYNAWAYFKNNDAWDTAWRQFFAMMIVRACKKAIRNLQKEI